MAIDFQQLFTKIREIGAGAKDHDQRLKGLRQHARSLLDQFARELDPLREKVERTVAEFDPNVRCALPTVEYLDYHRPAPGAPASASLIAIDGSQISPDRHADVLYGLINIGAIAMQNHSAQAPDVFTTTTLMYGDEVRNEKDKSLFNEGQIALMRDTAERRKMLELVDKVPAPIFTFTDGPVELWGSKDPENADAYRDALKNYLDDLRQLNQRGVTLAGYVDKPSADLIVRLLEIAIAEDDQLRKLREYHPLIGVSDLWLMSQILGAGDRSAIFAIQNVSRKSYKDDLAIHFFYLNVGTENHPAIARVEAPQWVVRDAEKLNHLHALILQQCALMGAKPYPYILHRAHETAVVKMDERRQIEQMIKLELYRAGSEVGEKSGKQAAKDLDGRSRK
jgi:hypothetical protein